MAIEDLEEQNVLLPEEEWETHSLRTTVNQIPVLLLFLCAAIGCAMTFWGSGGPFTWIGIGLFFITFFGVVWLCDRAILKQRRRFQEERENLRSAQESEQENQPDDESSG